MRHALRYWSGFLLVLVLVSPVLAQDKKDATPPQPGLIKSFFTGLFDDWTGYLFVFGLIALIALIGAYIYVKKKQSED